MKIITNLTSLDCLDKLNFLDEVIIPSIYSIYYDHYFDEDDIIKAIKYCNINNIKAIVSIDALIEQEEINEVKAFIDKIKKYNCDIMFSDFAILSFCDDIKNRLVYNAPTYICNYKDIEYYKEMGIRVMLSNELSLDDVKLNCKYDNVILQVYGFFPIYYSKRKVVTLYKQYYNNNLINSNINELKYEIKEETRNEKYKVIEYNNNHNNHSVILSANKICIYKELKEINPNYIYINTDNIEILKIYKMGVMNNFASDENILKEFDERVDKSLLYIKPSILNKNEKN